jgi:hypothetical protein
VTRRQTACKPGSVPPRGAMPGTVMTIPLGRPLPNASCDRPERRREGSPGIFGSLRDACRSYLVLLPVGFSLPPPLPAARCALTAPFHPCRPPGMPETGRRCTFCGTFPGVAPAGRYPAPCLRGARTFLSPQIAESGHPTVWHQEIWVVAAPLSKAPRLSKELGRPTPRRSARVSTGLVAVPLTPTLSPQAGRGRGSTR